LIRDLEICTFNLTDTKVASNHKISRIELCEKKDLGGITPRRELIKESLQNYGFIKSIPLIIQRIYKCNPIYRKFGKNWQ